ncbi:MAG: hypothetical protein ABJB86_20305 [Bacteroidota bacterium]
MKKIVTIAVIIFFAGCDKKGTSMPQGAQYAFPKNTEWVGTLDGNGFQYRPPCSLKFNTDNTFTMYGNFLFFSNNAETRKDSISGTILSTDSLPDGRIRITTNIITTFNNVVTKYIYISNRNKIMAVSADGSVATFQLELFPAAGFPVIGTQWRGVSWPKSQVSFVPYACPDLSTIVFQDAINTVYIRNGLPVMLTQFTQLQHTYKQIGARVYMAGYKYLPGSPEGAAVIINAYLGILAPAGDRMMVDSYSPDARLPNYINTNEPYGPNGQTPVIYKY